jgi:hypothetical protein
VLNLCPLLNHSIILSGGGLCAAASIQRRRLWHDVVVAVERILVAGLQMRLAPPLP